MKEMHILLEYIDYYIYVGEEEKIVIMRGPCAEKAQQVYDDALKLFFPYDFENQKWEFDIALDCVRQMGNSDREYVRNHTKTAEYHLGYAMEIRNRYIHPARKHLVLEADCVSSRVMKIIFSIVSPIYDYRGGLDSFDNTDLLCSISVRTFNSLKRAGINSILEFAVEFKRNPEEVLKRRHLGRNSITELLGILGRIGFLTKTDNEP